MTRYRALSGMGLLLALSLPAAAPASTLFALGSAELTGLTWQLEDRLPADGLAPGWSIEGLAYASVTPGGSGTANLAQVVAGQGGVAQMPLFAEASVLQDSAKASASLIGPFPSRTYTVDGDEPLTLAGQEGSAGYSEALVTLGAHSRLVLHGHASLGSLANLGQEGTNALAGTSQPVQVSLSGQASIHGAFVLAPGQAGSLATGSQWQESLSSFDAVTRTDPSTNTDWIRTLDKDFELTLTNDSDQALQAQLVLDLKAGYAERAQALSAVPEPRSALSFALGLLAVVAVVRRSPPAGHHRAT